MDVAAVFLGPFPKLDKCDWFGGPRSLLALIEARNIASSSQHLSSTLIFRPSYLLVAAVIFLSLERLAKHGTREAFSRISAKRTIPTTLSSAHLTKISLLEAELFKAKLNVR